MIIIYHKSDLGFGVFLWSAKWCSGLVQIGKQSCVKKGEQAIQIHYIFDGGDTL